MNAKKRNIIYIVSVIMLYSNCFIWSMNLPHASQSTTAKAQTLEASKDVTIVSSDNQEIKVPESILPLMPVLHDFYATSQDQSIPLEYTLATLQPIIQCITEIKRQLKTRNELLQDLKKIPLSEDLGNHYIPQEVNQIVEKILTNESNDTLVDIIKASHFFGAEFITNACAKIWVAKQFDDSSNIDFDKAIERAEKQKIADDIINNFIVKQVDLKNAGANEELSIADLIALNKIPDIENKGLRFFNLQITDIKELYLSNLQITDLKGLDQIKEVSKLKTLSLYNNKLTTLDPEVFKNLTNLRFLDLSRNQLSGLEKEIFKNLHNLENLYLDDNKLITLDPEIFERLIKLQSLMLSRNQLSGLDKEIFQDLYNLEYLYLGDNKLITLDPGIFKKLTRLRFLGLSRNQLSELDKEIFQNLHNLEYLYLDDNKLITLDPEVFEKLTKLEWLDLSSNQLAELNKNIFQGLKKLKYLNLQNNFLTDLNIIGISNILQDVIIQSKNQLE